MSVPAAILGKVLAVKPRKGMPAATMLPIAEVGPGGDRWSPPYDEAARREHFPNAGRISWIEPPPQAVPETYWVFRTEFQATYDKDPSDPHRDKYRVYLIPGGRSWSHPAVEVIDVDALGGEPDGRERLTRVGIPLPPAARHAFHLKWGNLLTPAPLPFVRIATGLWVVDPAECKQSMEWRELPSAEVVVQYPEANRHFLLPEFVPHGARVIRDWGSDEEVFKHVLARLRKWDPEYQKAVDISDKAIARLAGILTTSVPDPQNREFHRHRIERVKSMLERASGEINLADRAKAVLEYGPLADAIERERKALLDEARREAKLRAEEEISSSRDEVAKLTAEVEQRNADLGRLDREIADRRAALLTRVEELDAEIEARMRRAVERPEALLADAAIARVFARVLTPAAEPQSSHAEVLTAEPAVTPELADESTVLSTLAKAFTIHDVPAAVARPLHASFIAGMVPLLAGARAREAITAYANVVCGDVVHWVGVSPGCLDPLDLFGQVDASAFRFVPAQGDLARVLARARLRGSMELVVLDGVTRAGVDSCLIPLLDSVSEAMAGRDGRTLSLLPAGIKSADGLDPGLSQFRWPANVLLAGIVRQGVTSCPPPAELWSRATFLMPDTCPHTGGRPDGIHPDLWAMQRRSLPATHAPLARWADWRAARQNSPLDAYTKFWAGNASLKVDRTIRDSFLRIFAASAGCSGPAGALHDAVSVTLLPALRSSPDALATVWNAAGCLYPDAAAACEAAAGWLG